MSQLDRIEAQNAHMIRLLEKLTGQQVQPTGMSRTADGAMFLPGTGPLGGQRHQPDDEPDLPSATPADARAAWDKAKANAALARTSQETNQ